MAFVASLCLAPAPGAIAQEFKSPVQRIDELEAKAAKLEEEVAALRARLGERAAVERAEEADWADGLLTLGNVELTLGGKAELLFLDTEFDRMPELGPAFVTDEPDPHLVLHRLRLVPEFKLDRFLRARAQIDFRPQDGETVLKEFTVRHDWEPVWWFDSRFSIGLDDRFIRPARRTKNYPLIGTAFWRDESLAAVWRLRFGHREGEAAIDTGGRGGAGTEGFGVDGHREPVASVLPPRRPGPFDFARNWGAFDVFLSIGQGYELNDRSVLYFEDAPFQQTIQDDRELEDDLALRELGAGLEWRRDFQAFGELGVQGFYFNDELRGTSAAFLEGPTATLELFDGTVLAGHGAVDDDDSDRWGFSADYFFPASTMLGPLGVETRRGDGLRLFFQWIRGEDAELVREGWYVQGSYRVSFGRLLADRYFRSLEPIVRYGRLDVDVPFGAAPALPVTWDRDALLIGAILEVTGDLYLKFEYLFHDEDTGGRSVDNDQFLAELLIVFG